MTWPDEIIGIHSYATHGIVEFLQAMAPLPLAAGCDLDAHGIVHDLTKRVSRPITPVGMDTALYTVGKKHHQVAETRAKAHRLALRMATDGPPALRSLGQAVAGTGGEGREQ